PPPLPSARPSARLCTLHSCPMPERQETSASLPAEPDDFSRAPAGALLFEIAWEVCNQVGGIYQVLRSKAPTLVERRKDRYCLIGPYVEAKAALEFEPTRASGTLAPVISELRSERLTVHHGR